MEITELQDIKPGMKVDIVVTTDYKQELTDVRRAIIYNVEDTKVTLSQPVPPFTRFYLNRGMMLTYLVDREEGPIRVVVFCRLTDIIQYSPVLSESVHAVVMMLKSSAELQNLRRHFRVRPSPDQNVAIYFESKPMNLVDVSIGGAMLSHQGFTTAKLHDHTKILMIVDGERFDIDVKILRIWSPYMDRKLDMEYITFQFLNLDKRLNYLLAGKIFSIKRENRSTS